MARKATSSHRASRPSETQLKSRTHAFRETRVLPQRNKKASESVNSPRPSTIDQPRLTKKTYSTFTSAALSFWSIPSAGAGAAFFGTSTVLFAPQPEMATMPTIISNEKSFDILRSIPCERRKKLS